jgi:putative nucleotidyltransferase with HDIG domain
MRALNTYVAIVCAAGLAVLALADWSALATLPSGHWWGLAALFLLALISEGLSVKTAAPTGGGSFTITLVPLLASAYLFGAVPTLLLLTGTGLVAEFLIHRKPLQRAAFNVSQYAIAAAIAGVLFSLLTPPGFDALALLPDGVPPRDAWAALLPPFVVYGFVFLTVNHSAVAGAIALSKRRPYADVWKELFGRWGSNIFYDLLISPVALAVAFLYVELGSVGLFITILPLYFIRESYLMSYKLLRANQDLLHALIKAIETRDPYTSGHSVRVSNIARLIASEMGLSTKIVERIAQSALLHDIGKIEAIYTEILRKPSSLSEEERLIIESHVTKGVELLTSLSSVSADVIADVRHHHERVDGRGYPDGLRGRAIPIGARIINVCDAIDAMLSDRPYRKALTPDHVRKELVQFAGVQFDDEVVACVIQSDVIEEHCSQIARTSTGDKLLAERSADIPRQQQQVMAY